MAAELLFIPLNKIRQSKVPGLRETDKTSQKFLELTNSVRQDGIINPISVRRRVIPEDNREYEVIDGLQRFNASNEVGTGMVENDPSTGKPQGKYERDPISNQMVGLIPAQVLEKDDANMLLAQTIANVQRIDTKPTEYAHQLMRILAYHPTMTQNQLAASLSMSSQWLDKILSLTYLDPTIKALVDDSKIPVTNAVMLAKLRDTEEQKQWVDRAQTLDNVEFTSRVTERIKEIKDAIRQGNAAAPEQFKPVAHLRNLLELKKGLTDGSLDKTVKNSPDLNDIPLTPEGILQAGILGAKLGLKWAIQLDDASVAIQQKQYEDRKKANDDAKARREQEKKDKRVAEAQRLIQNGGVPPAKTPADTATADATA